MIIIVCVCVCNLHRYVASLDADIMFLGRYLHAQVFEKYAQYFDFFLQMQPFLYVIPLTTRLKHEPKVAVSPQYLLGTSIYQCQFSACYVSV